jgi:hypothetical protein
MGAELNAGTGKETTSVYARVLDIHLERAFDVIAQMVTEPAMSGLAEEREVVLEEIAMYEDDPQDLSSMCSARPSSPTIRWAARSSVAPRSLPARPASSCSASTASATSRPERRDRRRRAASTTTSSSTGPRWRCERAPASGKLSPPAPPAPGGGPRTLSHQGHRAVPRLPRRRRHRRDDERRFALRVLDSLAGGTSSSRLFQAVREQRGLAYSVFSFQSLYAHTGQVGLYVGTRADNLAEVARVIDDELARLRQEPVSEEELARAKDNVKGRVVLAMESTTARMERLGASVLAEMPILELDEVIERIDAVDAEQIERAGERAVRPGAPLRGGDRSRRGDLSRRARAAACERRGSAMIRVGVAGRSRAHGASRRAARSRPPRISTLSGRADPVLGVELAAILPDCDVVVDFTPRTRRSRTRAPVVAAGVHVVIGTTGFDIAALEGSSGANVFIAPNFAIGAVLMMSFAAQAAKHMAAAEIIELHHDASSTRRAARRRAPPS